MVLLYNVLSTINFYKFYAYCFVVIKWIVNIMAGKCCLEHRGFYCY